MISITDKITVTLLAKISIILFMAPALGGDVSKGGARCGLAQSPQVQLSKDSQRILDAFNESPFNSVCTTVTDFENTPNTDYSLSYPSQGVGLQGSPNHRRPRNTNLLLIDLYEHVIKSLQEDVNLTEGLLRCQTALPNSSAANRCEALGAKNMLESEIPLQSLDARYHLSLSIPAAGSVTPIDMVYPNTYLDAYEVPKQEPWARLSQAESDQAYGIIKDYSDQIRTQVKQKNGNQPLDKKLSDQEIVWQIRDQLAILRKAHLAAYSAIFAQFPVLNFIHKPLTPRPETGAESCQKNGSSVFKSPEWKDYCAGQKELGAALVKTKDLRLKQIGELREMVEKLRRSPSDEIPSGAIDIFDWSPHLMSYLKAHPKDCGLTTSIYKMGEKRDIAGSIAIAVPLIGASIFVPPLAAASFGAIGATTSVAVLTGAGVAMGYSDYRKAENDFARTSEISAGRGYATDNESVEMQNTYLEKMISQKQQAQDALAYIAIGAAVPVALKYAPSVMRATSSAVAAGGKRVLKSANRILLRSSTRPEQLAALRLDPNLSIGVVGP